MIGRCDGPREAQAPAGSDAFGCHSAGARFILLAGVFADSPQAEQFAPAIEAVETLVVPVLTVYEVIKKLAREAGDETAAAALGLMQRGQVVPIDLNLALTAAVNGLPMADSLIYATARHHGAELWTQDRHFEGLPGVKFFAKP